MKNDSDSEDGDGDDLPDVDENDFFDDVKITDEDARALEMFQKKFVLFPNFLKCKEIDFVVLLQRWSKNQKSCRYYFGKNC